MLVSRLARANCKNFLACTNVAAINQRQLSTGQNQASLLSRPMNQKSLYHYVSDEIRPSSNRTYIRILFIELKNQRRELVAEITISTAFMGLYYLLVERTSDATMKPAYYMPYECGFNMLGGVVFFGFRHNAFD